jgi:heptosyltransferase-2
MSLPLLGLLGQTGPVSLCVLAPEYIARVYWSIAGVNELVVFERGGRFRRVANLARSLRALEAAAAVILPPSFSSAVGPFLARVKTRVGYDTDGRGLLLTRAVRPPEKRDSHLSNDFVQLGKTALERLHIEPACEFQTPAVRVTEADFRALEGVFTAGRIPEKYAVVVPGATYGPAKSWPRERFRELVRALSREIAVVLAGTRSESEACDIIADGQKDVYNTCGRTTLDQLFALLSRASVVIANDSGPPHVAASLGVPVVVLFGSTSPTWTVPLGRSVHVVRVPVDCSPCFRRNCPTQLECFTGIEPGEVLKSVRSAISSNEARVRL